MIEVMWGTSHITFGLPLGKNEMRKFEMKKFKLRNIILIIFFITSMECVSVTKSYSSNNKYFCLVNLNLRNKNSTNSKKILTIPRKSIVRLIKKDTKKVSYLDYNDYWCKILYNKKIGWVYGAYLVKYNNQDIEKFIQKYEFIKYFDESWVWSYLSVPNKISSQVIMKFSEFDSKFDKKNIELSFWFEKPNPKDKDESYIGIGEKKYTIDKIIKIKKGYKLFSNNKLIALVGMKKNKLIFYYIEDFNVIKNGIKVQSKEICNVLFLSDMTEGQSYWNSEDSDE